MALAFAASVQFTVTGSNPSSYHAFTDASGLATYQYSGQTLGQDSITVSAAGLSQTSTAIWSSSPPRIDVQSPAANSELPIGSYLLVGQAQAGSPSSLVTEVLVNGRHVDALDLGVVCTVELAEDAKPIGYCNR